MFVRESFTSPSKHQAAYLSNTTYWFQPHLDERADSAVAWMRPRLTALLFVSLFIACRPMLNVPVAA